MFDRDCVAFYRNKEAVASFKSISDSLYTVNQRRTRTVFVAGHASENEEEEQETLPMSERGRNEKESEMKYGVNQ